MKVTGVSSRLSPEREQERRKRALVIGLMRLIVRTIPARFRTKPALPVTEHLELCERGRRLRSAIDQRFASHKTTTFPHVIDVGDLARESLPEGISFDDAEEILRAAGFIIEPRPDETDKYDLGGGTAAIYAGLVSRFTCFIHFRPKIPGDYDVVAEMSATIHGVFL